MKSSDSDEAAVGKRATVALPQPGAGMPFVLIDDARTGGVTMLFRDARDVVVAHRLDEIAPCLARIERALAAGQTAAGYIGYEASAAFHPRWPSPRKGAGEGAEGWPLLWFGLFDGGDAVADLDLPSPDGVRVDAVRPLVTTDWYAAAVARMLALIAAGDIYQANLTFPCAVDWSGDPLALYARMRAGSGAGYGGIVDLGDHSLLSASPELFFTLEGDRITARPMKGTAPRGATATIDAERAAALQGSPKERAENLMITDLLRNDLSRVAVAGSVETPALFTIETYPTVLQMTSTVTAQLRPGLGPVDLLRATFPCGSVTGAPKVRAAEIIAEVEGQARGPYTGAIGWMREGAATFNVVIRTLALAPGVPARIGVGSAIVADSIVADEWAECLAKTAFLR